LSARLLAARRTPWRGLATRRPTPGLQGTLAEPGPGALVGAGGIAAWRNAARPHLFPGFRAGGTPCGAFEGRVPPAAGAP